MKKYLIGLIIPLLLAMAPASKKHILFFGDSITQLAVKDGGYIQLMQRYIDSTNQSDAYQLTGAGISGNKIYDLYLRMDEDVLSKQPDVVVIFIGVNDVWHKATHGTGTDKDRFEKFYSAIIKKLQAKQIEVILCTPAAIGERFDNSNQQDGDLNFYADIVRGLAKNMNCGLIDLRRIFMDYEAKHNLQNKEFGILTYDRVHLNDHGNHLVAREMMKTLNIR